MTVILLIVLALGIMLNSCGENESTSITCPIFETPLDSVSREVWFPELMAVNTRSIVAVKSKLCLVSPDENYLTYFIDENTGMELGYAGIVGNGPEDMQPYPKYVGKSERGDTLYLYDFNTRKIKAYLLADTEDGLPKLKLVFSKNLVNSVVGKYTSSYMAICRLANGYYVGLNFLSVGSSFLTLLDKELNVVKEFGKQPLSGLPKEGKIKSFQSFDGTLCAHGNSVYYAAHKFGYMARYDIDDQGEVTHRWTQRYADINYYIDGKQTIKFRGEGHLYGFSDMTIGKEYIFATYSGIPTGEMFRKRSAYAIGARTLVVFNHDGEPLGRFKLGSCSFSVGLSEDEEYLYVMNTDPEVQIERMKVKDILNKVENNRQ